MPCSAVLSSLQTAETISTGLMLKILQTRTSPSAAWRLDFDGLDVSRGLKCLARMLLYLNVSSFCRTRITMGPVSVLLNDHLR